MPKAFLYLPLASCGVTRGSAFAEQMHSASELTWGYRLCSLCPACRSSELAVSSLCGPEASPWRCTAKGIRTCVAASGALLLAGHLSSSGLEGQV